MPLGKNLVRLTEAHGHNQVVANLIESLAKGAINPRTISIREMAEAYMGATWGPKLAAYNARKGYNVTEGSADAVGADQFADITGQLLINEIKQKYDAPGFVGDQLFRTTSITNGNLGVQKTPWLSDLQDDAKPIQPGMPYPSNSFGEQYIEEVGPVKFGTKVLVTMEAIYADLTNQIMDSAGSGGTRVRTNKEEWQLQTALGLINNHKWNGTSLHTYLTTGSWINVQSGLTIVDWTDINKLEVLFMNMTDPVTGKPINIQPDFLLVQPPKYYTHKRIQTASDVRTGDGASATQATYAPSPLETNYKLLKSQLAYNILQTAAATKLSVSGVGGAALSAANAQEVVVFGNKKAFNWRQAEPFTTVQAPAGNWLDFNNDIALAIKCREWGCPSVYDPRYVVLAYNAGSTWF